MSNKKLDMIFSVVKTFLAILIAMVVALIIILCISDEPLTALHSFLLGPFTNIRRIGRECQKSCVFGSPCFPG